MMHIALNIQLISTHLLYLILYLKTYYVIYKQFNTLFDQRYLDISYWFNPQNQLNSFQFFTLCDHIISYMYRKTLRFFSNIITLSIDIRFDWLQSSFIFSLHPPQWEILTLQLLSPVIIHPLYCINHIHFISSWFRFTPILFIMISLIDMCTL